MILTKVTSLSSLIAHHTFLVLLSVCLFFPIYSTAASTTVVNLGSGVVSAKEKESYEAIITLFETENPDIKIRMRFFEGKTFTDINRSLLRNIAGESERLDLLIWYGGKRTIKLAQQGILQPLDDFWLQHDLEDDFSAASKENVSYNSHVYGIPISYYPWGFFYSKRVFARLDITQPKTWPEFLNILAVLKANKLTPIAIGTKDPWPAAGWFDYLILRNNSFSYYQQLMQGHVSYNSPQVIEALTLWQTLIEKKYFSRYPQKLNGESLLPLISREVAGLQLIGTYALNRVADKFRNEFGYFPFPHMVTVNKKFDETSEVAPLATVSLLKSSKHKAQALRFLHFLAQPEIQTLLNKHDATISPHIQALDSRSELLKQGKRQLDQADHLSQYFDRETDDEMAKFAKQAFADFIEHGDVTRLVTQLESQRKKVFKEQ